ncbi:MAG: NADH:flavin oxidoreductase [Verrucomicrobia bacterium]|nr:NADH:flavin oxidoreductase [Verrucomicrobiota bacterium]
MPSPTAFRFPKPATVKTAEALRQRFAESGHPLPVDDLPQPNVLASPIPAGPGLPKPIGNRWAILPMEGWDGTGDGRPTDLVRRRWQRFGQSGAKLIWGGEAVAVRPDGRANPHQLVLSEANLPEIESLRTGLAASHRERHGTDRDLLVGLQLTHSGRFARPNDKTRLEPRIAYRHPLLDARFGITDDRAMLTDSEVDDLIADMVAAAVRARRAGFDFVDLKHCHGYLGHEFLSAVTRPGRYGGSFANRTRFLTHLVAGIRRDAPGLAIGVRLSLFDSLPYQKGPDGTGVPMTWSGRYVHAFGANPENPLEADLGEPFAFLQLLEDLGIRLVCLTAASPYYNPHLQRPAMTPPSDGYLPPEDPLVGVARQIEAVAQAKARFPNLIMVGSAYTYLQEWLPHVASAQVAAGRVDSVGLGRMVLSYPDLPADVLAGRPLQRRQVCRTFSECTTGPRNGLVSGCFPLDDFYKNHLDAARLKA